MNDLYSQLPEYDPQPDLWARIEHDLDRLDADTASLNQAVMSLPELESKADLWNAIESQLANEKIVKVRPLWSFPVNRSLWAKLAVAAMTVLVGGWYAIQMAQSDVVQLQYSVEKTTASTQNDGPDFGKPTAADGRAEAFIEQQCAEQQLVCQRPEVHELRNQLVELSAEQQRLERERQAFGDDPTLIQAQVRLENQRATVTKELITLLRT